MHCPEVNSRAETTSFLNNNLFPWAVDAQISSFAILRAKSCLVKECGYGILPMWLEFCEGNVLVP